MWARCGLISTQGMCFQQGGTLPVKLLFVSSLGRHGRARRDSLGKHRAERWEDHRLGIMGDCLASEAAGSKCAT